MNQKIQTQGIILARTNFADADRIYTFITPDQGKIKAIVKGVRKSKSKMAGALEVFSVSHLSLLKGKNDIDTVISTRLIKHYGNIVKDIDRTNAAYNILKKTNKSTQEQTEPEYFELLKVSLQALNESDIDLLIAQLWFELQLLKLSGRIPNFRTDIEGNKLEPGTRYHFDVENMGFVASRNGRFGANEIKLLRLLVASKSPVKINDSSKSMPRLDVCHSFFSNLS